MVAADENDHTELERKIRNGDVSALADLFAIYRVRLFRTVEFRMDPRVGSRVGVDDILQEAFLDAARRIAHFGDNKNMSSFVWLRWIVSQTLVDVHRRHLNTKKRNVAREHSLFSNRNAQATSASLAVQLLGHLTSPSRAAMRHELTDEIGKALGGLSESDQEILALRHFEELTNQEVAEVLGIEQKAASIRYVRAVRRLKKLMDSEQSYFNIE